MITFLRLANLKMKFGELYLALKHISLGFIVLFMFYCVIYCVNCVILCYILIKNTDLKISVISERSLRVYREI